MFLLVPNIVLIFLVDNTVEPIHFVVLEITFADYAVIVYHSTDAVWNSDTIYLSCVYGSSAKVDFLYIESWVELNPLIIDIFPEIKRT